MNFWELLEQDVLQSGCQTNNIQAVSGKLVAINSNFLSQSFPEICSYINLRRPGRRDRQWVEKNIIVKQLVLQTLHILNYTENTAMKLASEHWKHREINNTTAYIHTTSSSCSTMLTIAVSSQFTLE